jgi:hypothetical protein
VVMFSIMKHKAPDSNVKSAEGGCGGAHHPRAGLCGFRWRNVPGKTMAMMFRRQNRSARSSGRQGFALVITLSLMILLVLLAVGMLSLSAISLRSMAAATGQQEARANARLALQLAIGDLQRETGPDQRITAPGSIVDPNAPRALTGVWRSYQATSKLPSADPKMQFGRWLISHPSQAALQDGNAIPPTTGKTAELIGAGSLGPDAVASDRLAASIIPTARGGYAYAVLDESMKARIDLAPRPSPYGEIGKQAHLGEARRFGIEAITPIGQDGFAWWKESGQDRLISLPTGQLLPGATRVKEFSNDLTVWSRGLLTDTARGGLRGDLSVLCEGTLPAPYATGRVYTDLEAATAPANPTWQLLQDYSSAYKKVLRAADGTYKIAAKEPSGNVPYSNTVTSTGTTVVPTPGAVSGYPMMPVVTKLEMVFSLFTLNAYDHWGGYTEKWYIGEDFTASSSRRTHDDATFETQFKKGTIFRYKGDVKRRYQLMMMYSPIVTVYNPFNVPIEFDALKVGFDDLPIGFLPRINNVAQLTKMAHFNQLYFQNESLAAKAKRFELVLRSNFSSAGTPAPLVIPPGETIVLGNSADPNKDFWQVADFYSIGDQTSATIGIDVIPGWSEGIGYVVDWLAPRTLLSATASMWGIVALRREDMVDMEFGPLASTNGKANLTATVDLVRGANSYPGGVINMEYGSQLNLTKVLTDQVQTGLVFPQRLARPRNTMELYEFQDSKLKDYKRTLPFAMFSFRNKATVDSGTATRPGVSHPPSQLITNMKLATENPAIHAFETRLVPFEDPRFNNERGIQIDAKNRGYGFTGHSLANGVRAFPLYELPLLPPQSIAQLRHAQLASSGHLPGFTYTAGESWAHPMIPRDKVTVPTGTQGYPLIDHAWLANNELWDSWFYSTLCSYQGPAFTGTTAAPMSGVLYNFFTGSRPLINSRLSPHVPAGTDPAQLVATLGTDPAFFRKSASYLWVEGPFNVNSVSKNAWKAVLTSLNKCDVPTEDRLAGSGPATAAEVQNPFLRQRRPVGPSVTALSTREQRWRGFRTLGEDEIERLAQAIVDVVKERGPFLSLADFVNRRPGSDTQRALRGALQEAIDRSGVNDIFSATVNNPDRDCRDIPLAEVQADGFAFPEAIAGKNAQGAPSFLTQGDILSALGTTVAVRGDTFRIRAYGESTNGNQITRAWCEAVVQRTHDFVDPANAPETAIGQQNTVNKAFGRRFNVVAFRWLSPAEL